MRSSTSCEDSWLDTTVNGPAPTGVILNCSSPWACRAVGETIQFTLDDGNELITAALGWLNRTTTVSGSSTVIGLSATSGQRGAQVQGELTSRVKLNATASASNGVPSLKVMPGRIVIRSVWPPSVSS